MGETFMCFLGIVVMLLNLGFLAVPWWWERVLWKSPCDAYCRGREMCDFMVESNKEIAKGLLIVHGEKMFGEAR